ncbi:MAG: HepT-like ribonuclease domain-containing protein [Campylobacterota bacterium]|nr:HepT-like ribonuclease domain-containing protein [Campylobacterota bacterium]
MFDITKVDRDIEFFIFDIYVAIQKIKKVSSSFDNVQELLHNFMAWDSVIREFEIIGEASKYLLKEKLLSKDYQVVVDFRNHITHEYFGIDSNIVWATINIDLDPYESTIIKIIHDIKPDLKQELIESFITDNNYLDFIMKALEDLKNA